MKVDQNLGNMHSETGPGIKTIEDTMLDVYYENNPIKITKQKTILSTIYY